MPSTRPSLTNPSAYPLRDILARILSAISHQSATSYTILTSICAFVLSSSLSPQSLPWFRAGGQARPLNYPPESLPTTSSLSLGNPPVRHRNVYTPSAFLSLLRADLWDERDGRQMGGAHHSDAAGIAQSTWNFIDCLI